MSDDALALCLCQLESGRDVAANLDRVEAGFASAAAGRADLLALPENVLCRGTHDAVRAVAAEAEVFDERLGALSRRHGVAAVWGGVPVRRDGALFNTSLLYDADGRRIGRYEKIHLFQYAEGERAIDETTLYTAGRQPLTIAFRGWRIGVSICYDLRFPELYRACTGVDLLLCTAEFTHATGRAHWELLLRARAVENQCFMIGVGQCGMNPAKQIRAYGHSLAVDPWGEVLAAAGEEPVCLHVTLDPCALERARARVPALASQVKRIVW